MADQAERPTTAIKSIPEKFWDFSSQIYDRPGVAPLCLVLQDRYGFDVNIILLCVWLAREDDAVLDAASIGRLEEAADAPNRQFVRPVRAARRWLKSRIAAGTCDATDASAYEALKVVELHGERLVQSSLIAGLPSESDRTAPTPEEAARSSLENYQMLHQTDSSVSVQFDELVSLVFR